MPSTCPRCGAAYATDETCEDRFNELQLLEVQHLAYYAVRQLSVPRTMLQHNVYSREGWIEVRAIPSKFVQDAWTPALARRHIRGAAGIQRRTWSFTKGARLPGVEKLAWECTIAEIRHATAEQYCADVRHWVEQVLADSEDVIRGLGVHPSWGDRG